MTRLPRRDVKGVVAVFMALMLPCFLILVALIVDVGFWLINAARLQIAADAAAMVAGTMMLTSAYQGEASATQITNAIQVAAAGAQLGANQLTGTITPNVTIDGPNYTTATVTLTMPAFSIFGNVAGGLVPTLKATASASIAPQSCVLALATSGNAISVGTGATLTATNNCPIFSDANIANSGTLSGYTVGAVGTITNSGTITPSTTSPGVAAQTDYLAGTPAPTYTAVSPPASCTYTAPNLPATIPASPAANPIVICGQNRFIGGTITFDGGIYYIYSTSANQGFIAFDGSTVKFASGTTTTFVLVGQNSTFYLYDGATIPSSAPLTAPTSGATAGLAIWQPCTSSGVSSASNVGPQFGGAGTGISATISGTIYAPCNTVTVSSATVAPPSGSGLTVVANTISVSGVSASLKATATRAVLTTPVLVN